jgi:hypothetical protein
MEQAMLPSVRATSSIFADYPSSAQQQPARPSIDVARAANDALVAPAPLSRSRMDVMSLSGQLQLAQGFSVFGETVGKLLDLPRYENETLVDYAKRITEAVQAMNPAERAALERMLVQLVKGLPLRLIAGILKDPIGPDAARLSAYLETVDLRDQDPAAKAALTSYRQTDGAGPAPIGRDPARTAAPAPMAYPDKNATVDQVATDVEQQLAGKPAFRGILVELATRTAGMLTSALAGMPSSSEAAEEILAIPPSPGVGADTDSDADASTAPTVAKQISAAAGPNPADKLALATGDAVATTQLGNPDHVMTAPARPDSNSAMVTPPRAGAGTELPGGSIASAFSEDGASAFKPQPIRPGEMQAASSWPDAADEMASGHGATVRSEPGIPAAPGKMPLMPGSASTQITEASHQPILQATNTEHPLEPHLQSDTAGVTLAVRPAAPDSILVVTEWLVKEFAGDPLAEALRPLLNLPGAAEEPVETAFAAEIASETASDIEEPLVPNRPAANTPAQALSPEDGALAKARLTAAETAPHRQAAEAADMARQLQLALPLILPRDGIPFPYVVYPPTEQEHRREERRVREITEVDEDGGGQQHSTGEHDFQEEDRDGDAQGEPPETAEAADGQAGEDRSANDLYWRMAGWS